MPRRKSLESGATTELALSGTDGSTHPPSSGESGTNVEIGARLYGSINAELKVRIRFPPAASQANVRIARVERRVISSSRYDAQHRGGPSGCAA